MKELLAPVGGHQFVEMDFVQLAKTAVIARQIAKLAAMLAAMAAAMLLLAKMPAPAVPIAPAAVTQVAVALDLACL